MLKILCIGDSLTYGNVGYSYIHFLSENIITINKGLNGDTLYGLTNRLRNFLKNDKYNYDFIVLGIGTNDILLPYLKNIDSYWKLQMSFRFKFKKYVDDNFEFLSNFETLIKMINSNGKKVIVFGIPYINLEQFPKYISLIRNEKMKLICDKYEFDFIDIYSLQSVELPKEKVIYSWKWSFLIRTADAIEMTIFPENKDKLARKRKLIQTVDGVHFSSRSAEILAREIESKAIRQTRP